MNSAVLLFLLLLVAIGGWLVGSQIGPDTTMLLIGLVVGVNLTLPASLAIATAISRDGRHQEARERPVSEQREQRIYLLGKE